MFQMDDTRQKLIDSAGEVFAEKGFAQTTIRDICQRAGTNVAAVNYHFGSKEDLYIEAVKAAHFEQCKLSDQELPPDLQPEEALRYFIHEMMTDMLDRESPSWKFELIMREMSHPTQACEELVRDYIGPKFELLESLLEVLLPSEMPLPQRRLFAFSIVGQCLLYRYHRPVGRMLVGEQEFEALFDVERLTDHLYGFCLAGIRAAEVRSTESAS